MNRGIQRRQHAITGRRCLEGTDPYQPYAVTRTVEHWIGWRDINIELIIETIQILVRNVLQVLDLKCLAQKML